MNPTYQEVKAALKEKGLRIKHSGSNQGIPTYEVGSLSDITGGGRILWLSDVINIYLKNPAAVALGRLGGSVKSDKKSKSSAANGALGGRPRKTPADI